MPLKIEIFNPVALNPVAEQTFIWTSRFKKILGPRNKSHFLFLYHRMVKESLYRKMLQNQHNSHLAQIALRKKFLILPFDIFYLYSSLLHKRKIYIINIEYNRIIRSSKIQFQNTINIQFKKTKYNSNRGRKVKGHLYLN